MPAYVPKSQRKPSQRRRRTRNPSEPAVTPESSASVSTSGSRIRTYLDEDNGRNFDLTDPSTPESHLIDANHPSWYVPSGQEPHMRDQTRGRGQGRVDGSDSSDINPGDVGRFKKSDWGTRATNEHDHSKKLTIYVSPQMFNELSAIVDCKAFPVRSIEGLARTYLYEMIELTHRIAKQDGIFIPHSHRAQLEAAAIVNRGMQAVLEYDAVLSEGCNLVRQLLGAGARNKARAAVFDLIEIAKKMNSTELRDMWNRKLHNEFGYLLKGKGAQVHVGAQRNNPDDDGQEQA